MDVSQVLSIDRIMNAVFEAELPRQRQSRHNLETRQDQIQRDRAARDQPVAVLPVFLVEHSVWSHRLPKAKVIQRVQPSFNILNIFKNNHARSVPNIASAKQIWSLS